MKKIATLVIGLVTLSFLAAPSWADDDEDNGRSVHGAYTAELDLNPLGLPRIEAFGFVLNKEGTVTATSEHEENDLESAGVGVWKRLRRGKIGLGVYNYRMGTMGGCAIFFGLTPPDNCTLKLGATLKRVKGGDLVGEAFLSFEELDGEVLTIPVPLPLELRRLSLDDFPRPTP